MDRKVGVERGMTEEEGKPTNFKSTETGVPYDFIQDKIDSLIGKLGSGKVFEILDKYDSLENNFQIMANEFIMLIVCQQYNCSIHELKYGTTYEMVDARSICFFLLNEKLKFSVRKIGKEYSKKQPAVQNGIVKLRDIINSSKRIHHKTLMTIYFNVEPKVDSFLKLIENINENGKKRI